MRLQFQDHSPKGPRRSRRQPTLTARYSDDFNVRVRKRRPPEPGGLACLGVHTPPPAVLRSLIWGMIVMRCAWRAVAAAAAADSCLTLRCKIIHRVLGAASCLGVQDAHMLSACAQLFLGM